MLGWINLSIESFVVDTFGADKWDQILKASGVHKNWVSSCPYSDKITYDLVVTAAGLLGVTVNEALEAYGAYFVRHVQDNGYTKLLHVLGSNVAEFLQNLNNLHLHLSMGWPSMQAPAFRCEAVTPESLLLHYHSSRPGLWPIVVGVLKGMSKTYFGFELGVELVQSRDAGADHEVFRLTYPRQTQLEGFGGGVQGDEAAGLYAPPPAVFYALNPFHVLVDEGLAVVQAGAAIRRIAPALAKGDALVRHFKLRHPYVTPTYDAIVLNTNTSFLLLARESLITLKGAMVPVPLPAAGGGGGQPRRGLLFLGTPRCGGLAEMQASGLYLSDIPVHDMGRDFILLAEQRQAEADLKERFERMAVELKAANEKLARTTRWLEDEKARADALLYRMSGLIACFPSSAPGGGGGTDERAAAAGGGGGGSAGVAPDSGLLATSSSSAWAAAQSSDDGAAVHDSVAAVAALLREAGVRAPALAGDSVMGGGTAMTFMSDVGAASASTSSHPQSRKLHTIDRIEAVRRELTKANVSTGEVDHIQCCELLGEGSYGKVYKGLWKGSVVAVKTIVLPAMMSGAEKREKMAVMEAAISTALSHPNILQTYTYDIRPLADSSGAGGPAMIIGAPGAQPKQQPQQQQPQGVHSFEVRLVLEYCDCGSLRDALDRGAFVLKGGCDAADGEGGDVAAGTRGGGAGSPARDGSPPPPPPPDVNYRAVLDTAIDVATAMAHLHGRNVLHADLKARNIMLKSNGAEGRGVSAKVADFGLSVKMDTTETHMSHAFQGTMSHMAPEILMHGRLSKAGDVYAFGVMLWELMTGGHPFSGVPKALLGHMVTKQHRRPEFPRGTPAGYAALAARCWDPKPSRRPTMDEVLAELKYLRRDEPAGTPALAPFEAPAAQAIDSRGNAVPSAHAGGGASGAGGGGGPAGGGGHNAAAHADRSIYLEQSVSTVHEGPLEGLHSSDDIDGGDYDGDDDDDDGGGFDDGSSSGDGSGGGGHRGAGSGGRCPFGH